MPSKIATTNPSGAFQSDSFKYSPLQHVRSLYVAFFFKDLFAASPVGEYHWEPDSQISEIYITDEEVVKGEVIGMRPAISLDPLARPVLLARTGRHAGLQLPDRKEEEVRIGSRDHGDQLLLQGVAGERAFRPASGRSTYTAGALVFR